MLDRLPDHPCETVCEEAVSLLDEAALPCARCYSHVHQFSCWPTQCCYALGTQSWNLRPAISAASCDSCNGTCPQVRVPKPDVVVDVLSVVRVCRLTDSVQILGDPVSDLQVGSQAVEARSLEKIFVHLLPCCASSQRFQSFPCWLHIFFLQTLMTSACVWQVQPKTSILANRNWRRLSQVHFNATAGTRCAVRALRRRNVSQIVSLAGDHSSKVRSCISRHPMIIVVESPFFGL